MSKTSQRLFQEGIGHADPQGEIGGDGWSIIWQTLRGGVSEGVMLVTLSSGPLTVTVCPTRGMGVLAAQFDKMRVGWTSPVAAPVHPQFVNQTSRNHLGWLEGFNELVCRCGLAFNGPPGTDSGAASPIESDLTLHGRIANTPAHTVEFGFDEATDELWIRGECREAILFGPNLALDSRLSFSRASRSFAIADTVTNLASFATELELLYHINVGPPILGPDSRFLTSFREMSPRDARAAEDVDTYDTYLPPTTGYAEQVYFFDPLPDDEGQTSAMLANTEGTCGFSVHFDSRQLPCLSQWKCTQPEADGYVTGIEPGTNFPNFKSFEREHGRVLILGPGQSHHANIRLTVHPQPSAVQEVATRIAATQSSMSATVHPEPTRPFAPN